MVSDKLSLARIKIKFPEELWISHVFNEFPEVRMKIQYFLPYNFETSIGNSIFEIMHYNPKPIIEEIKKHPSIIEFSLVEQDDNRIKINVKTKDPYLLYAVIKCGVLIDFPINVREGYAYWRLISTRGRIDALLTIFDDKNIEYELLRIGNAPYNLEDNKQKLSLEESETLQKALDKGFFEVPRKISLEALAKELGKSKSALSVMLRKIIRKKVMIEH